MSKIANILLEMAKSWANTRGSKMRIIVDEHGVETYFKKPEKEDKRIWESLYPNTAIYFRDFANPFKISSVDPTNDEIDVITTERYKIFMQNKIVEEALNTDASNYDKLEMLLYITIGSILFVGFALAVV